MGLTQALCIYATAVCFGLLMGTPAMLTGAVTGAFAGSWEPLPHVELLFPTLILGWRAVLDLVASCMSCFAETHGRPASF